MTDEKVRRLEACAGRHQTLSHLLRLLVLTCGQDAVEQALAIAEERPSILLRVRGCASECSGDYQRFLQLWRDSSSVLPSSAENDAALDRWHQRQARRQKFAVEIHPNLRAAVLKESGWTCSYCGSAADTVDHVLPRSRGGTTERTNLVAACRKCNSGKGARTPEQWREALTRKRDAVRQDVDHMNLVLARLAADA